MILTVGTASNESFGTSAAGSGEDDESQYEAADTPPTTEGLEVLTPEDQIRQGGRIKIKAEGFDAEDSGVLAVSTKIPMGQNPSCSMIRPLPTNTARLNGRAHCPVMPPVSTSSPCRAAVIAGAKSHSAGPRNRSHGHDLSTSPNTASSDVLLALTGMATVGIWRASAGSLRVSIAGCSTLLVARHRDECKQGH